VTEEEAAERLCELLNEVEEAGIVVMLHPNIPGPGHHISIGQGGTYLAEPPSEDEPWEVRES
jgi:hypothetical protein